MEPSTSLKDRERVHYSRPRKLSTSQSKTTVGINQITLARVSKRWFLSSENWNILQEKVLGEQHDSQRLEIVTFPLNRLKDSTLRKTDWRLLVYRFDALTFFFSRSSKLALAALFSEGFRAARLSSATRSRAFQPPNGSYYSRNEKLVGQQLDFAQSNPPFKQFTTRYA